MGDIEGIDVSRIESGGFGSRTEAGREAELSFRKTLESIFTLSFSDQLLIIRLISN